MKNMQNNYAYLLLVTRTMLMQRQVSNHTGVRQLLIDIIVYESCDIEIGIMALVLAGTTRGG